MKKHLIILLSLSLCSAAFAQNYSIKGQINNCQGNYAKLYSYYGERNTLLDSSLIKPEGDFSFSMKKEYLPGMYLITVNDEGLDLVWDNENIEIKSKCGSIADSLQIIKSQLNKKYFNYLSKKRNNDLRLEILSTVLDYYPEEDAFYSEACTSYKNIQKTTREYINKTINEYPDSFLASFLASQKKPLIPLDKKREERASFMKDFFFIDINLNDTSVLRSRAYNNLVIDYLTLYTRRGYTQEQQEEEFIKAVDRILGASMENSEVFNFIMKYLVEGFEKYHLDKVLDHIAVNYGTHESCENENLESEVQKRLQQYQKLSIGKDAPPLNIKDINGNTIKLSNIKASKLLILFWASWCPHCNEMLPRLKELYKELQSELEIIAISLDNDPGLYQTALEGGDFPWINACDYKGWDTETAVNYNVYATPTMFLLSSDRKIIAKPISFPELLRDLEKQ